MPISFTSRAVAVAVALATVVVGLPAAAWRQLGGGPTQRGHMARHEDLSGFPAPGDPAEALARAA